MKISRFTKFLLAAAVLLLLSLASNAASPKAKYVFYMIGDGMGINQVTGTGIYNKATGAGPEVINFTQFPVVSYITTYSGSALVTDSAAAGTALATGVKTYNGAMGVDMDKKPVSSVADWAKASGFGAGVATSVGVNHATPAAFYAHAENRSEYEKIAFQLIDSKLDFAAGAGFLNEVKKTGHDSRFLEDQATAAGFSIIRGDDLKKAASYRNRVLCFSANPSETELKYAVDRGPQDTRLSDFVQAGIDNLYAKYAKKGFFFMIEGGKIDYAGHNNDAVADFMELNDFADAVDVVLAFYEKHPDETLIVVTADHETGGLMLGAGAYEMHADLVAPQKKSEVVLNTLFKEFVSKGGKAPSWEAMKAWFKENLGLWGAIPVDAATERSLWESYERSVAGNHTVVTLYSTSTRVVSEAIEYANRKAGYVWAHGTHTGSPVGLYVKGKAANAFLDCRDNIDVPVTIAKVAGYAR